MARTESESLKTNPTLENLGIKGQNYEQINGIHVNALAARKDQKLWAPAVLIPLSFRCAPYHRSFNTANRSTHRVLERPGVDRSSWGVRGNVCPVRQIMHQQLSIKRLPRPKLVAVIRGLSVDESRVRQATGVSADRVLPIQCPPRTCPSYAKPRARASSTPLTTSSCAALSTDSTIRQCRYPYYLQTSSSRHSRTLTTTTSPFLARIRLVVSAKRTGTPEPPHTKVHARVEELPFRYASRCPHA